MEKIYDYVETICISIVCVCFCFAFLFRIVIVEGTSMYSTLDAKDKIVIAYRGNLEKGDIVVTDENNGTGKRLIKRVIATGGDTIKISYSTGEVYVNGELLNETYILEPMENVNYEDCEITVEDGYLFLMGDNRNNSLDSRSEKVGVVNKNDIIGKVFIRLNPNFGKVN